MFTTISRIIIILRITIIIFFRIYARVCRFRKLTIFLKFLTLLPRNLIIFNLQSSNPKINPKPSSFLRGFHDLTNNLINNTFDALCISLTHFRNLPIINPKSILLLKRYLLNLRTGILNKILIQNKINFIINFLEIIFIQPSLIL